MKMFQWEEPQQLLRLLVKDCGTWRALSPQGSAVPQVFRAPSGCRGKSRGGQKGGSCDAGDPAWDGLEVGSITGSSEEGCEPDMGSAAGSGDTGTSVMLMPACRGHLGADTVSKGKDGVRKGGGPCLFCCGLQSVPVCDFMPASHVPPA